MIVVFTLCSANYLAQARTLADSVAEYNPDYHMVVDLVDRMPDGLDPATWQPHEIIPVENLGLPELRDMVEKYHIVELNTALKPYYMEYLYRRDTNVRSVIYLDPDILLYAGLDGS